MIDRDHILTIDSLTVSYQHKDRWFEAVRDFSMSVPTGQVYGLVGESGSGKSTVALAVMRYLSTNGRVDLGTILFAGQDLLQLSTADMREIWGSQMALVPQDPLSSLNPSLKIGEQIAEILRQHAGLNRRQASQKAIDFLRRVQVPDPERVAGSYPHEISGGMQQRALIAMAICTEPRLLVLDEPTTGLDVTTQAAVLELLQELIEERQTSALYVTHNLGVVARVCDRVAVLYAGELVEDAAVGQLFSRPWHPYSKGLLDSVPQIGESQSGIELQAIPGQIPALQDRPTGCVFAPRCTLVIDRCFGERPPMVSSHDGRKIRCFRWQEIARKELSINVELTHRAGPTVETAPDQVLDVDKLRVYYKAGRALRDVISGQPGEMVRAVDGINLRLAKGLTLGVVGESGSGKTTLARAIVGLVQYSEGEIILLGSKLSAKLVNRSLDTRKSLQYIFQNPEEALNPYMTIGQTLRRPFVTLMNMSRAEADAEVEKLLLLVKLTASYTSRLPNQLSGGEKQRVAIARAFATHPDLLIADEPVSALDVSVQAAILNLLSDLQAEDKNTLIFISHDLAVVAYLADLVAVMYAGKIMEMTPAKLLFQPPFHPYTEALLSAIPTLDPHAEPGLIRLQGDVPSQIHVPSGCPFHPRCPRYLGEICASENPPLRETEKGGHIFCHMPLRDLEVAQRSGTTEKPG